jgi:crotonobetainyl-CoA:carnitine CoA-transferase CaiB-like acyl-CoA transferase
MTLWSPVLTGLGCSETGEIRLTGEPWPEVLASPLAVAECAIASVAACLAAAAELGYARTGRRPDVTLDTGHVAAAVRGEVWLRDPAGRPVDGWAPLSRLWRAGDGWVRTHGNYPWHRAALLTALGVADGPDEQAEAAVAAAVAARPAREVERAVYQAGGLAVAARTEAEWLSEQPVEAAPLVGLTPLGAAPPLGAPPVGAGGSLPAAGVRVLDLTRVIAGPVGTRMLAAVGAEVLRIDDPRRPEPRLHAVDGVVGKASAALDADTEDGRRTLHRLIADADVVVTGYRPGAMRRLGLDPDQIADRHPGTVVATLSAWGTAGTWGTRRGFDSLVQVATGIGWATSTDGTRPGTLPCQLLDHATGYLLAAGVLAALTHRERTGKTLHASLSLARTARWLLDQGRRETSPAPGGNDAADRAQLYRTDLGDGWSGITAPGSLDGRALSWPNLPPRYLASPAAWRP